MIDTLYKKHTIFAYTNRFCVRNIFSLLKQVKHDKCMIGFYDQGWVNNFLAVILHSAAHMLSLDTDMKPLLQMYYSFIGRYLVNKYANIMYQHVQILRIKIYLRHHFHKLPYELPNKQTTITRTWQS